VQLTIAQNGHLELVSDQEYDLPLVATDAAGNVVPMPAGNVSTVSTTGQFAASLVATIGTMPGTSNPSVHLVCAVLESDAGNNGGGIGLALTDSAGLPIAAATSGALFDIVQDVTPVAEGIDFTGVAATPNPTPPTAAGP
jgi:hypothetical protein